MARKSSRKLRLALTELFFRLLKTKRVSANPFELCSPNANILIVRQQNQMGDMLLATPCLRALRQSLPKSRLVLLASHENEAVVRNNPYVNEVLVYDKRASRKNPLVLLRFIRDLRRHKFDICVVLSTVSFSVTSALLCLASSARYRISYSGESYGLGFVDRAFNVTVPLEHEGEHQTELGLRLLEPFGVTTTDLSPIMVPTDEDERFAEEFLSAHSLRPETRTVVVGIHPGAGKTKNRWSVARFASVAKTLHASRKVEIVVVGGPSDAGLVDALVSKLDFAPTVLTGESIGRVAAVVKRLSLFICNDTGVIHVAAAVGCSTLALFGPTDPLRWAPLTPRVRALAAPSSKMDELAEETVLAAAVEMLSSK